MSIRNSNASLRAGSARDPCTAAIAAATSAWGQRPEVANGQVVRAEHRPEPVARVICAMLQRDGALQHGSDALAQPPRGFRLGVPDGLEDLQYVGGRHLGDGPLADAREDVVLEAPPPVAGVARVAPALPQLVPDPFGDGGEQRYALGASAVGERVSAVGGEFAVGEGFLAGLGERDEPDAAESDVAPPAADRDALDPAAGAGGLDDEVESVPVTVSSDRCAADERGRQALVGMLSTGLELARSARAYFGGCGSAIELTRSAGAGHTPTGSVGLHPAAP